MAAMTFMIPILPGEAGAVEELLPGSTGSRRFQYDEFLDLRPQAELPLLSGTRRILQ